MRKRILLSASVFVFLLATFLLFSYRDRAARRPGSGDAVEAVRRFVSRPTSQASRTLSGSQLPLSPGEQPRIVVYDEITRRRKYQLEAKKWEPNAAETGFNVTRLELQIFMPRGEITYINADEAEIILARKPRNRVEAQRGTLRGHVKVVIDRTTDAWREAHPGLAARETHPDELIHIDMESARFDMDRAELISEGAVRVDSTDVRIEEVRGLTVHWDEVDNRIEILRFEHGGRMVLRRGAETIDFALPGTERRRRGAAPSGGAGGAAGVSAMKIPRARANQPMTIETITAEQAAAAIRLEGSITPNRPVSLGAGAEPPAKPRPAPRELRTREALTAEMETMKEEARTGLSARRTFPGEATLDDILAPHRKKVHTYRAVFAHQVEVRQFSEGRAIGELHADTLEVHFDFGSRQRRMAGPRPPAGGGPAAEKPARTGEPGKAELPRPPAAAPPPRSEIVLTWSGPLELRPIAMDPKQQTGERFDVIASGSPVRVRNEQGRASCGQLVYRSEPRQIWLSSREAGSVELSLAEGQSLVGREIFFDQKRGLGRIDGEGRMHDAGLPRRAAAPGGDRLAAAGDSAKKVRKPSGPREPVTIRWMRGVDLEVGRRVVRRLNPQTGLLEDKEKEFLRRAWFHGKVFFERGDERLNAEEVAATFFVPKTTDPVSEQIEHLNLSGAVRLERKDEFIAAEQLDVDMVVTPAGRNIPRKVDASGGAVARQGRREIRGETLHVVLGQYPGEVTLAADGKTRGVGKPRLGVETLDASGNVRVADPDHNLEIGRTETLKTTLRNGNELVRATVVSAGPEIPARARFGNMAIHGHRIELDVDRETIDVPGPGKAWLARAASDVDTMREPTPAERAVVGGAWMLTRRKLGLAGPLSPQEEELVGRAAVVARQKLGVRRTPPPLRVVWSGGMQMRLARDYGVLVGDVYARQEGLELRCDKLTVRFVSEEAKGAARRARPEPQRRDALVVKTDRRRPAYIIAEGHAKAFSSDYTSDGAEGGVPRLVSRIYIGGDQIVADLEREQMSVPCAGSLLIEDYQIGRPERGLGRSARDAGLGPLMGSVRDEGPSQTLIEWSNAMDFFVDRGLVSFDRDVSMFHCSGQNLLLKEQLAESMNLSEADLQRLRSGRRARLTCGTLLIEFLADTSSGRDEEAPLIRANDLRRLIASDAVLLVEGDRSLMGDYLQYLHETQEIRLEGSETMEARIFDEKEGERLRQWFGPLLIWNRQTNRIESPRATIRTSSR